MKLLLLTIACAIALNSYSQNPNIQWQNIIAGDAMEEPGNTIQSIAGDYYSIGATTSTAGDLAPNKGNWDAWITKIDANGNFAWKKNIGGSGDDLLWDVIQTNDGNFIATGGCSSQDGDLNGVTFNSTKMIWLVKFDATGTILWQKKIGGSNTEVGTLIKESPNGELNIFATSYANNLDILSHYGSTNTSDIVYFRLSATGAILEQKTYGGSEDERLTGFSETNDGGFVVLATSTSTDYDITQHIGSTADKNAWVFKIDVNKNIAWEKSYFINGFGTAYKIKELSNGHIMFSFSDNLWVNNLYSDGIVITLNAQGNLVWQKAIGGAKYDEINDMIETSPNHILLLGSTGSNDSIVTNNIPGAQLWILEIDSLGIINSQQTYGGTFEEIACNFIKTNDNGLVVTSKSRSHDLDVINPNVWNCLCQDVWIFKLSPNVTAIEESTLSNSFSIFPNPANDIIHINASTSLTNESYSIINTLGQTVLNGKLENDRSIINVQTLQSGIYFLQIGSKQAQSYKIIKN